MHGHKLPRLICRCHNIKGNRSSQAIRSSVEKHDKLLLPLLYPRTYRMPNTTLRSAPAKTRWGTRAVRAVHCNFNMDARIPTEWGRMGARTKPHNSHVHENLSYGSPSRHNSRAVWCTYVRIWLQSLFICTMVPISAI